MRGTEKDDCEVAGGGGVLRGGVYIYQHHCFDDLYSLVTLS